MRLKRHTLVAIGLAVLFCAAFLTGLRGEDKSIKVSTTTSTVASGLLDILLPALEKETGIKVQVIAKGTGAAIRDGEDGNVDVVFVHEKGREEEFVKQGFGTRRYAVMHNDFVVVGPAADPAGIRGARDAARCFARIARSGAGFASRGDDSGTHAKEQELWKQSGAALGETTTTIVKEGRKEAIRFVEPEGAWYRSLGQGMGETLTYADEKQIYTLADRGTYVKYRYGKTPPVDLAVLCEGDPLLRNYYSVIPVSPKKHPGVKYDLAVAFAQWLTSPRGQAVIANYRLLGHQLFYPDAAP